MASANPEAMTKIIVLDARRNFTDDVSIRAALHAGELNINIVAAMTDPEYLAEKARESGTQVLLVNANSAAALENINLPEVKVYGYCAKPEDENKLKALDIPSLGIMSTAKRLLAAADKMAGSAQGNRNKS